jgi:hypothetical protein
MMLYKPFVSLAIAFAAASSVAASVTLVPRGDDGYPPPDTTPISETDCTADAGTLQCCDTFTSPTNPLVELLASFLDAVVDPTLGVGLSCLTFVAGTEW